MRERGGVWKDGIGMRLPSGEHSRVVSRCSRIRRSMQRTDIQFPAKDAALREDVHELGALVGEVLREQGGSKLFQLVEGDRIAAIRRREGSPEGGLNSRYVRRIARRRRRVTWPARSPPGSRW